MHNLIDPTALNLNIARLEGVECVAVCLNPAHIDHNPSFYVNLKTGFGYCHSCGFSVNAEQIIELTGGVISKLDKIQAKDLYQDLENGWQSLLKHPLAFNHPYLQKRKVTNELVDEFNIRYNHNAIIIPLPDIYGEPIGVMLRYLNKNYKGKYRYLGNFHSIFPKDKLYEYKIDEPVFVLEGIFGVLNFLKNNYQAIALLGATRIPKEYFSGKHVYVGVFDDDMAGYKAAINLLFSAENSYCYFKGAESDEILKNEIHEIYNGKNLTQDAQMFLDLLDKKDKQEVFKRLYKTWGMKRKYKRK